MILYITTISTSTITTTITGTSTITTITIARTFIITITMTITTTNMITAKRQRDQEIKLATEAGDLMQSNDSNGFRFLHNITFKMKHCCSASIF